MTTESSTHTCAQPLTNQTECIRNINPSSPLNSTQR